AWLHAVHAGLSVRALRTGGHFREPWRRLAGGTVRHSKDADDRPDIANSWVHAAVRARSGLEWRVLGRLGGRGTRHFRRGQGLYEDGIEIGDQGDIRGWLRATVPLG